MPYLASVEVSKRYSNRIKNIEQIKFLDMYNSNLSRSIRKNYKTRRNDRTLIRKEILWSVLWAAEILWSVLWAALKTSARAKSYDFLYIYTSQDTR